MHNNRRDPINRQGSTGKHILRGTQNSMSEAKVLSDISAAIKLEAEEKFRKKQLRRQIRKALDDLFAQGEACETSRVLAFIQQYQDDIELVREVLSQFGFQETFPIKFIWQYLSDTSLEDLSQRIEEHKLLVNLTKQRDTVASKLAGPLVMQVETAEQGPLFTSLTAEQVQRHIVAELKNTALSFQVKGMFPFSQRGEFPLLLDFSHGVTLPITLRLEAQPDPLPLDCLEDFKAISHLAIPAASNIQSFLQGQLAATPTDKVIAYCSKLSMVLVTAYHYGYGNTSWTQNLLYEWRSKRSEYFLALELGKIKGAIEHLNLENGKLLLVGHALRDLDEAAIQEIVQKWLRQDPILSRHELKLVLKKHSKEASFSVTITWKGIPVGSIELQKPSVTQEQQKLLASNDDKLHLHVLESTLDKVLHVAAANIVAESSTSFNEQLSFTKHLKQEVLATEIASLSSNSLPNTLSALLAEAKKYNSYQDRAEHFLQLVCIYGEKEDESFLRYALAQYCFWRSWQHYYESTREARPYLQGFLFLHNQMVGEDQRAFMRDLYQILHFYFHMHIRNFPEEVYGSTTVDIAEKFYTSLLQVLAVVEVGRGREELGRCLVEVYTVNSRFISELLNRMKTGRDIYYLSNVVASLQEPRAFRIDPLTCLRLLVLIDPNNIARALSRQSLATAEERHGIVTALLKFADSSNVVLPPSTLLSGLATSASTETRLVIALSLLQERFVLHAPKKERELKAAIIAETLGLPSGTAATEYFLGKVGELAYLFDRFMSSQKPDEKSSFVSAILENIRATPRRLIEFLRENPSDILRQFFGRAESFVIAEQAKLIRDTTVELVLVSDRTLHSLQQTRIVVEIRNVGEGSAEHLVLKVSSVPGQYNVAERYSIHTIDTLTDKMPVQKELFVQPLVGANSSIQLSLSLRYDTLKEKDKVATLTPTKPTIWFYPDSEFARVRQPYNPGVPATTWFYGRRDQLESMADNLRPGTEHDTSMIVYGIKRAGKTSVVRRFIGNTLDARNLGLTHIPIYVDLLKDLNIIRNDGDFLYFLVEIITRELSGPKYRKALPFTLSQSYNDFQSDPQEAFSLYLEEILRILGNQHLLLVLDEFSTLYNHVIESDKEQVLTPQMFSFLSSTIQHNHQLTFVFTGTYILLDMMRTHMYDLAKICSPFLISFLDDTSARQLITEPVQRDSEDPSRGWLEYDHRVIDRIVTYTHSHPYLIQYICMQIVNRMNGLKYRGVNLSDLDAVINDIIANSMHEMVMLNMWQEFESPQQKVLSIIAQLAEDNQSRVDIKDIANSFKAHGETISFNTINNLCKGLEDAKLLEKFPAPFEQSESYQVTIPLYQMWLKQNKPLHVVFGKPSIESASYQRKEQ